MDRLRSFLYVDARGLLQVRHGSATSLLWFPLPLYNFAPAPVLAILPLAGWGFTASYETQEFTFVVRAAGALYGLQHVLLCCLRGRPRRPVLSLRPPRARTLSSES